MKQLTIAVLIGFIGLCIYVAASNKRITKLEQQTATNTVAINNHAKFIKLLYLRQQALTNINNTVTNK